MKNALLCIFVFFSLGITTVGRRDHQTKSYMSLVQEIPSTQLLLDEMKRSSQLEKEFKELNAKADVVLPQLDSIEVALETPKNVRIVKREIRREARNNQN